VSPAGASRESLTSNPELENRIEGRADIDFEQRHVEKVV
jgi:hypothetical protein